jgi:hypothetical protein
MKKKLVHFNWGACGDWVRVRSMLKFLRVPMYGNFCDAECYVSEVKQKLETMGFKVTQEEYPYGNSTRPLLRLTDGD